MSESDGRSERSSSVSVNDGGTERLTDHSFLGGPAGGRTGRAVRSGPAGAVGSGKARARRVADLGELALLRRVQGGDVARAERARSVPVNQLEEIRAPDMRRLREDLVHLPPVVAVDQDAERP